MTLNDQLRTGFIGRRLSYCLVLLSLILLTACPVVHYPASYGMLDIESQDLDEIRKGNLLLVRDRFEKKDFLNIKELAFLCEIYIKHMSINDALSCLNELEKRPDSKQYADSIQGKRALIKYILGDYQRAASLSKNLNSDGGRYIYALAMMQLGDPQVAIETANEWELSYQPTQVFMAANLFLVNRNFAKALETLQEPERRLDRDYSLSGSNDIFGLRINPAPLRLDMFGEFSFGLLNTYSYAAQANPYVEYALALAELETGTIDKAKSRYDKILIFPGIEAYRDILWRALYDRGRIAELNVNPAQAQKYYQNSIEVIESVRASISTDAGRIGFVGNKQDVYGKLVSLLLKQGEAETAFNYTERARSRALVDLLAFQDIAPHGKLPLNSLKLKISLLKDAENLMSDAQVANISTEELKKRKRGIIQTRRYLGPDTDQQSREVYGVSEILDSYNTIKSLLKDDEILISYFHTKESGWHIFPLQNNTEKIVSIPLNSNRLENKVKTYIDSVSEPTGEYKESAEKLYTALIGPIESLLSNKKRLTIIPYGELHQLPFSALLAPDNKFLIEKYSISILPSANLKKMLIPDHSQQQNSEILAIGSPDIPTGDSDPNGSDQKKLVYARDEVQFVADLGNSHPLLGPNATKKKLFRFAPNKKIVHIASHGEFIPETPLKSHILFTPEGEGLTSTSTLTVNDLLAIKVPWNVNLTVLSACKTSSNEISSGNDIIGLQRGFLYAGTESIVGTLWSIEDYSTLVLMKHFYRQMDLGKPPSRALQLAQIDMLNNSKYKHPSYWAAFMYTGLF